MGLESKIKQSVALLTVAVGIGLFTKYTGIDDAIKPDKNNKEIIVQTEDQKIAEKYHELTKPIYKEKTVEKKVEKKIEKTRETPEIKKTKHKTSVELILEEESVKNSINNIKYTSSNTNKSYNNIPDSSNNKYNNEPYDNIPNTEKKVFVYHQNLSSDEMMKEAMEVTDYWMPHFYEIKQEKQVIKIKKSKKKTITKTLFKTVFEKRASEKKLENIMREAYKNTQNIMPMVSAFDSASVMHVLNNPYNYAKRIHKEIDKIGANGVSIDLESIKVGKESSEKLDNFMKVLRKEMPKYIITIAVSPRFEGSAENGFKHHAFYDYKELAKYADYINIMFYDFHKDKVGPIAPARINDKVSQYALTNIPPEKIVMLYPLYGNVWEHKWKKKKEIIKSLGPLSSNNVDSFIQGRDILYKYYEDGELIIKTKDRTVYAQDETTFYNRTKRMDKFGLKNIGLWKMTYGTEGIYTQIDKWKHRQ